MTKEELKKLINSRYPSQREFVQAFNLYVGFEALNETSLSRQLSENSTTQVNISKGWQAAFVLFFYPIA